MRSMLTSLLFLALAGPALAVDGVLEINQACASQGCFTGDAAGLPVEITQPGSYRLTGTLVTLDPNQTLIVINSDRVTLDLNGFSLRGPNFCVNPTTEQCSNPGTGIGIQATALSNHITIKNGHIERMGSDGVQLIAGPGQIYGLNIEHCGDDGIQAGFAVNIYDNTLRRNGANGILLATSGNIHDNLVELNGSAGVRAETEIEAAAFLLVNNVIVRNAGFGLALGSAVGYRSNVMRLNNGGNANPQVSGGLELDSNVCGLSTTCP